MLKVGKALIATKKVLLGLHKVGKSHPFIVEHLPHWLRACITVLKRLLIALNPSIENIYIYSSYVLGSSHYHSLPQ